MLPRYVKVEELREGDAFVRHDGNVAFIEKIQPNKLEPNRLLIDVYFLGEDNQRGEERTMNLRKTLPLPLVYRP